ncbi:MAG: septum formation protein Maf, partial [Bryobacteraceae bacterium]|nr:septum formation protein Maf [Bryobacteraceae bacterium]
MVLASQSPRRQEILRNAGFVFEVRIAGVPEERHACESPMDYVKRLAEAKASAVHRQRDEVVLGADTVVVIEDLVLEKPNDMVDAARMLRLLSGREHEVITGIAILGGEGFRCVDAAITRVWFTELTETEIGAYVSSGEPLDKAGAYGIQGLASRF